MTWLGWTTRNLSAYTGWNILEGIPSFVAAWVDGTAESILSRWKFTQNPGESLSRK
jgi:hypothetical protein